MEGESMTEAAEAGRMKEAVTDACCSSNGAAPAGLSWRSGGRWCLSAGAEGGLIVGNFGEGAVCRRM